MKKTYLIFASLMILGTTLNAQWVDLVTPTINHEIRSSSFIDLEISLEGEPYLLYNVEVPDEGWKLFVQKYNIANEEWSVVGDDFVNDLSATDNHIAIDSDDNVYVGYMKLGVNTKGAWCMVKKFDGTDWITIADWELNTSAIIMSDVTMYCDNQDDVYVSYFDNETYSGPIVKRYLGTGSDWETLGDESFLPSGQCLGPALTTDNDGNVLVSFGDGSTAGGLWLSVKKFNGTNWEYIGSPGFWDEPNYPTSIIVGHNDVIHATTTDFWSLTSTVLNYQNNSWGNQFICYDAGNMPFTKSNNEVYMGHAVSDNGYRVRVKKVDGSGNWVDLPDQPGQYCITPGWPRTFFDIEADNYGNLYLAYLKGDPWNHHVSVIKLDVATGISVPEKENYTIYPNPTNGIINVSVKADEQLLDILITDISGKVVFQPNKPKQTIDLSGLKKGIYFANITTSKNHYIEKLIVR